MDQRSAVQGGALRNGAPMKAIVRPPSCGRDGAQLAHVPPRSTAQRHTLEDAKPDICLSSSGAGHDDDMAAGRADTRVRTDRGVDLLVLHRGWHILQVYETMGRPYAHYSFSRGTR